MQEVHSEAAAKTQLASPTQPWSEVLPIYPAAQELFDPFSNTELQDLAKNIKANGVCTPVIIYGEDGVEYLLDGRNRLNALQLAGDVEIVKDGKFNFAEIPHQRVAGVDPVTLATSLNVHRRHLTREAKRALIGKLLKIKPEASDHQIARLVGVSDNTVKAVRRELVGRCQIDNIAVRTDTKGRRQPASKPRKTGSKPTVPVAETTPATGAKPPVPALPIESTTTTTAPSPSTSTASSMVPVAAKTSTDAGSEPINNNTSIITAAVAAAALNTIDPREMPRVLAELLPAHRAALERFLKKEPTAHPEIAELAGKCLAYMTHPEHHREILRKLLSRIRRLAENPEKKSRDQTAAKCNARLDCNAFLKALGYPVAA